MFLSVDRRAGAALAMRVLALPLASNARTVPRAALGARRCLVSAATPAAAPIPGDHMKAGFGLPAGARSFTLQGPFTFECGDAVPSLTLGYSTYGTLNAAGSNAVIVGHSLTSNSCVDEWWGPLVGPGPSYTLDTDRFYVVCANYLGSVYGSTGPQDVDPRTGRRYCADFPITTLRDNVLAQKALLDALGVRSVAMAVGGSLGGMLALEWGASFPHLVQSMMLVATCAQHTDWAIGWGEVGRQAIYADPKWADGYYEPTAPPIVGMSVARQAAMMSYRTPYSFTYKFKRAEKAGARSMEEMLAQGQGKGRAQGGGPLLPAPYFDVEGYLNYQGDKFMQRMDPLSYVRLTQLLDSHDLGRGRGGDPAAVLSRLHQPTLLVGIDSDLLYPLDLQRAMAASLPHASLHVLSTPHGHDGFLIEIDALNKAAARWVQGVPQLQQLR